jgi:hypothetical protein
LRFLVMRVSAHLAWALLVILLLHLACVDREVHPIWTTLCVDRTMVATVLMVE